MNSVSALNKVNKVLWVGLKKGRISHDLIGEISDSRCKVLLLASPAPVEGVPMKEKTCFPERMTKECLI